MVSEPAAPVPILRFRKRASHSVLTYGTNPVGAELRCEVDGGFVWSRTCRTTKELRDEFQRIREDFDARGWHDEQAGEG